MARYPPPMVEGLIKKLEIDKQVDYKIITPDTKNLTPFGDQKVDMLGLFWAPRPQVEAILDSNPSIKWIHSLLAGVDGIMGEKIKSFPAPQTNARGAFSDSLGEFVSFGMLWHSKLAQTWVTNKLEKKWEPGTIEMVRDKTQGIFGYGDIGYNCAKVAKNGFGTKVIAMKRDPSKLTPENSAVIDECWGFDRLDDFIKECDYIVNCAPLTPQTNGMWNKDTFGKMKKSAVFMNIGRGPSVNEQDLYNALVDGVIAGSVQDVFAVEPQPENSPLWNAPNLFMTPHCADITYDYHERSFQIFADNIIRYKQGGLDNLVNRVDKNLGY